MDIKALLAEAKRPERSVDVCLRADLRAEWEALTDRLEVVRKQTRGLLNDAPEAVELARQITELEARMAATTVEFRFRALNRQDWVRLVAEYPPREGNKSDEMFGCNLDEVGFRAAMAGCVTPELDDSDWESLNENLSHGQWAEIQAVVMAVNMGGVDVPFSPLASKITQKYAETSKQPTASA